MKILLLNDRIDAGGGSQLMARGLADGLRRRGHDVRILASRIGLEGANGNTDIDYLCFGAEGRAQNLSRVWNPSAARTLRRALREFDPDVVHVRAFLTQLSPSILPLLRDRPSVMHAVMYDPVCPTAQKLLPDGTVCERRSGWACGKDCLSPAAFAALMTQRSLWRAWRGAFNTVVANSAATAAKLEAEGIGPARVIWNAVPEVAQRAALAEPPTAAVVGRLSREKGVRFAIEAFTRARESVPDARLIVVGDGPERAHLEGLVSELRIVDRVEFAGHLSRDAVDARLQSAWVQIVPSVWDEPFGLVAAEASMRGAAVIASNRGGLAEIVKQGETGLLTGPGDVTALAEAMVALLSNRDRAEAMGAAGREHALHHFTMDRMLREVEAVYHEIVPRMRGAICGDVDVEDAVFKQRGVKNGNRHEQT